MATSTMGHRRADAGHRHRERGVHPGQAIHLSLVEATKIVQSARCVCQDVGSDLAGRLRRMAGFPSVLVMGREEGTVSGPQHPHSEQDSDYEEGYSRDNKSDSRRLQITKLVQGRLPRLLNLKSFGMKKAASAVTKNWRK